MRRRWVIVGSLVVILAVIGAGAVVLFRGGGESYCDVMRRVRTAPGPAIDERIAPPDVQVQAYQAYLTRISDDLDALVDKAPDAIRSDLVALIGNVRARTAAGDPDPVDDKPELQAAARRVRDYDRTACRFAMPEPSSSTAPPATAPPSRAGD